MEANTPQEALFRRTNELKPLEINHSERKNLTNEWAKGGRDQYCMTTAQASRRYLATGSTARAPTAPPPRNKGRGFLMAAARGPSNKGAGSTRSGTKRLSKISLLARPVHSTITRYALSLRGTRQESNTSNNIFMVAVYQSQNFTQSPKPSQQLCPCEAQFSPALRRPRSSITGKRRSIWERVRPLAESEDKMPASAVLESRFISATRVKTG